MLLPVDCLVVLYAAIFFLARAPDESERSFFAAPVPQRRETEPGGISSTSLSVENKTAFI